MCEIKKISVEVDIYWENKYRLLQAGCVADRKGGGGRKGPMTRPIGYCAKKLSD